MGKPELQTMRVGTAASSSKQMSDSPKRKLDCRDACGASGSGPAKKHKVDASDKPSVMQVPVAHVAIAKRFLSQKYTLRAVQSKPITTYAELKQIALGDGLWAAQDMLKCFLMQYNEEALRAHKATASMCFDPSEFVLAYLFVQHPDGYWNSITEQEHRMIQVSETMLRCFEKIAEDIASGLPWRSVLKGDGSRFHEMLDMYWRTLRCIKLGYAIGVYQHKKLCLQLLEEAASKLQDNDYCDEQMRAKLNQQRITWEAKLKQAQKVGPRSTLLQFKRRNTLLLGGRPPLYYPACFRECQQLQRELEPGFGGMEKGAEWTAVECTCYELLIDASFRWDHVPFLGADSCRDPVLELMSNLELKAQIMLLTEDLRASPPSITQAVRNLVWIRGTIQMMSEGHPEFKQIVDVIDTELIEQQFKHGVLDCEHLFGSIARIIASSHARFEAQQSKEETIKQWLALQAKMKEAAVVGAYEQAGCMAEAVVLLKQRAQQVYVDHVNLWAKQNAVRVTTDPEELASQVRQGFKRLLAAGKVTLERTRRWITHAVSRALAGNDARVCGNGLRSSAGVDYEAMFVVAMTNLVVEYPHWGGGSNEYELPETLQADLVRVKALHMQMHINVTAVAILVTIDQVVKQRIRNSSQVLKAVCDSVMSDPPRPNKAEHTIQAALDVLASCLPEHDILTLKALLNKHIDRTHPVYKCILEKTKTLWYQVAWSKGHVHSRGLPCAKDARRIGWQLRAKDLHKIVAVPDGPDEAELCSMLKFPPSTGPLLQAMHEQAARWSAVVSVNRQVYASWYDEIMAKAIAQNAPRS